MNANLQQLMQMGQQLQAKVAELQQRLETQEISASAGGGMVTATVDGKGGLKSLSIDPTVVDPDDVEMLEDLVMAAVSEAQSKARNLYEEEMRKATGGLPMQLPGLF
jgi:DNA-binding YbaB/EbfC family protein